LKKLPLWPTLDLVVPYAALGQAIGRLGCFLNGCCQGKPVSWGIYFPVHQASLHPTQLYSAASLLLIFVLLKSLRKLNLHAGSLFFWYLILASGERFFVQFLRADYDPVWGGLGVFQIVNVVTILLALVIYGNIHLNRRP
jgi:phosphatidylglycerol:prolipoprotein diacylglycerol transferase